MTVSMNTIRGERFELFYRRHPGVVLECCEIADYSDKLSRSEMQPVESAVQSRKREFSTGRWLAHRALARQGAVAASIPPGKKRQPQWPDKIVGSIAHNQIWALAAVASGEIYSGIGIDIERRARVDAKLVGKLLTEEEQRLYSDVDPTLIFSAKEAVYKLLYPLLERYIDFLEVEIILDVSLNLFSANFLAGGDGKEILDRATGTFIEYDGNWLTFVSQPQGFTVPS